MPPSMPMPPPFGSASVDDLGRGFAAFNPFDLGENDSDSDSADGKSVGSASAPSGTDEDASFVHEERDAGMTHRRLLIQVSTTLSELQAEQARRYERVRPPAWELSADGYAASYKSIQEALGTCHSVQQSARVCFIMSCV
jgi:hypothetical protein